MQGNIEMNIVSKLGEILENQGKRNTLYQLRLMSERQLIDCGYSPELLSEGVKAWPWRELTENIAPLRFVQTLNHNTVSAKIEILAQQDAA